MEETKFIAQRIRSHRRPNGLKARRHQSTIRSIRWDETGESPVVECSRNNPKRKAKAPTTRPKRRYGADAWKREKASGLAKSQGKKQK